MVHMDKLKELLKVVLYTGYIKNAEPVNLMLVAMPDSGKSALMSRIVTNKGIIEVTDLTAHGIAKMIAPILEREENIKHIIIPDFIVVLAKNKSSAERTISFINSFTEEGITNIASYLNHGIPFNIGENAKKKRIRGGLITAMTESEYARQKKKLNSFGFLSRFIIVRYNYSSEYFDTVLRNIWSGRFLHKEMCEIELPNESQEIKINEDEFMFNQIKILAINKIEAGKIEGRGGRQVAMFKALLQAIALKNGRTEVSNDDYKEFLEYEPLINYSGKNVESITNT